MVVPVQQFAQLHSYPLECGSGRVPPDTTVVTMTDSSGTWVVRYPTVGDLAVVPAAAAPSGRRDSCGGALGRRADAAEKDRCVSPSPGSAEKRYL
jgi:hypothetical protein